MAIQFCTTCYPLSGIACGDELVLDTGLTALTTYYVWVKDRFDRIYVQEVISEVDGSLTVDLTAFPDGLFNKYAGSFLFTVSTSDEEDTEEEFTIGSVDYTCFIVTFSDEVTVI